MAETRLPKSDVPLGEPPAPAGLSVTLRVHRMAIRDRPRSAYFVVIP